MSTTSFGEAINEAMRLPVTDFPSAQTALGTHYTVKPGPYGEMTSAEIVQLIARRNPGAVTLADFDACELRQIHDGLRAVGVPVEIASYSKTQL